MRKSLLKIFALSIFLMGSSLEAFSQMSDEKVIEYVQQQVEAGKDQQQIVTELLKMGVSTSQIRRLIDQYKKSQNSAGNNQTIGTNEDRMRKSSSARNKKKNSQDDESFIDDENGQTSNARDQKNNQRRDNQRRDNQKRDNQKRDNQNEDDYTFDNQNEEDEQIIYGHNIFSSPDLTFEPNPNLATPKNYILGPGDEVFIDIWGESEDRLNKVISPEGSITIPQIGPVYLNGLTIEQADKYLKGLFGNKYAGLTNDDTQVKVTLGNTRSITVNVMGEVTSPGTLTISPFSTVFSALYQSGGVNPLGSIRNIKVMRNGKQVGVIDLYDYLFHGKLSQDIRLQEGDVIMVPAYSTLINITGNVKRPMYYEMLPGESISKLIEYAGGFAGNAYTDMVTIMRNDNVDNMIFNVPSNTFSSFDLQDGDVVNVSQVNDRYQNRVDLRGAVLRPGFYAIDDDINTIGKLMHKSEGVLEDAFTERVLIYRQADDLTLETVSVNLKGILNGTIPDVPLKRNDMIVVSSLTEIFDMGTFSISGPVMSPGTYQFAANTTVEDLIMMAGGLKQGASLARADVARRIIEPYSTTSNDTISQIFSFAIKDGFVIDGNRSFTLLPYDIVQIRESPGYSAQKIVTVEGQVLFAGQYVLQNRNERLSDIIKRCGGVIPGSYIKGASLVRTMTEDEILARNESMRIAKDNLEDSISSNKLLLSNTYAVGIDMEAALKNPGSYDDIVLRPDDRIYIPEQQSTIKISGDVMNPTVTTYVPGKKYKYYIDKAGGYGEHARKNKAFIVYLNGQVEKLKKNTPIEPGSQIIIPSKPQTKGTDWTQIVALTSSFASLSTMAATLYNIFK